MMLVLPYSAAAIVAFFGTVHLGYALHDCFKDPKYFRPLDASLLTSMQTTRTAIAPDGAHYWAGVLGFHLSHSIGVIMFGVMIWVVTSYSITWLQTVLIVTGLIYVMISHFCWFRIPTLGIGAATALMSVGWLI
jgi:hypothetical protein